mgnify:CR=1 FL=1
MFDLPDHPDIDFIIKNGYPRGHEPKSYYCEECGEELEGEDIFEDDTHEYLCAKCLLKLYEKRW